MNIIMPNTILGPTCWIVPGELSVARYHKQAPDILVFSQQEFTRLVEIASEGLEALATIIKAKRMFHGAISNAK